MSQLRKYLCPFFVVALIAGQLGCAMFSNRNDPTRVSGDAGPAPHFKPGFNLFSPEQDVELGRQSAHEIVKQVPLLGDESVVNYIRKLGATLAAKASGEKFPYQFNVVGTREINAFALPGGFIFVNAGTIAAAKSEGELAGVIAHEITHVALRHGTNQASKAYLARAGLGVLGAIAGSGDNPEMGEVVESIGGAGANMVLLKFGRTAETQADLEGARIMADAGFDPRDMASFFKTLEAKGGADVPEFLSDHPDPGNRIEAINKVIPSLQVRPNPVRNSEEFQRVKALLTGSRVGPASEPARIGPRDPNDIEPATRPQPPASAVREYQSPSSAFAFKYPENWDGLAASDDETNLIFAPKGAYGQRGDAVYVTHGIFVGVISAGGHTDLDTATRAFLQQQISANPDFRIQREPQRVGIGGRQGLATIVAGPSPVTSNVEIDVIYTTVTSDGRLFYLISMAPQDEFQTYQAAFAGIIASLQLAQ